MDTQPPSIGPDPSERLESWKEIAAYLNKGVRTVIRWEKTEGLPVHRHQHQRKASVFAYRHELDAWWQSRHPGTSEQDRADDPPPGRSRLVRPIGIVTALVVLSAAFSLWQIQVKSEVRLPAQGQPLTSYPGHQFSPTFSPDGARFAFAWNGTGSANMDIYAQAVGSDLPQRLTHHPDVDFSPAWSPDGRTLAFLRRNANLATSVFVMPASGGMERKLVDLHVTHYMDGTQLSWTPDSAGLAVGDTNQGRNGLFLIHVASGATQPLTACPARRGHLDPAFSPDGRRLAYRCGNSEDESQICLIPLTQDYHPAGPPQTLTRAGMRATSPVWTTDGRFLIYSSGTAVQNGGLYRLQVLPEASGMRRPLQLTSGSEYQFSLGISHRTGVLAYTRRVLDVNIWAVHRRGATWEPARQFLEISSSGRDIAPDFSPDGRRIAFASDRSGIMEVWIAASDGSHPRRLTSLTDKPAHSPRWSPDGTQIVFAAGNRRDGAIYVANHGTGAVRLLSRGACCPSWSRDGRWIYFNRDHQTGYELVKISALGGKPARVSDVQGANDFLVDSGPVESPDGQWLVFRRTDGIWKVPIAGGQPTRIVDAQGCNSWTVRAEGLFMFRVLSTGDADGRSRIFFYPGGQGAAREIASTRLRPEEGLAVSPDGNTILFSQTDYERTNIMFLRDF